MSSEVICELFSPEAAKAALEKSLDQTPRPRKARMEQVDHALVILSSKFPDIAASFERAKSDHITLTAYVTEHLDAIEAFLQGREMEEDTRKTLCANLSSVHGALKNTAKWRNDVEKQQLPRVERRAIAVFLLFCQELKEEWEDRWCLLRDRLGDDALAKEEDAHATHQCGGGSDFLCAHHRFEYQVKEIEQRLRKLTRRALHKQFEKLLSALLRYEQACKALLPELEAFDRLVSIFQDMGDKPLTPETVQMITSPLEDVKLEHKAAMRVYKQQKRLTELKVSNDRQKSDLEELSCLYALITSSYKYDLEEFRTTYSRFFHAECNCPHALPESNEDCGQSRWPKYPSLMWIGEAIDQLVPLKSASKAEIYLQFYSAARDFDLGLREFHKFRDHNKNNLYTDIDERNEDGTLQHAKIWSAMVNFESFLLNSLNGYQRLHDIYQELKDKIAVSSQLSMPSSATVKTSKAVVFRCFTYLAVMRDHFSNLLYVGLLQSRKDPEYMKNEIDWTFFDHDTRALWHTCRDSIYKRHSKLAKVLFGSMEGSESKENCADSEEHIQRCLEGQVLMRETMSQGSECYMMNCDRLETRMDILKSYSNAYLGNDIAQALNEYLDKHTKDVVAVTRHFGAMIEVTQCEEPI